MEEYKFPENNWYIEIDDDNIKIVNNWKRKQEWSRSLLRARKKYVDFDGNSGDNLTKERILKTKITTEQFKQYVLKEPYKEQIITQDYSYLVQILNKLGL